MKELASHTTGAIIELQEEVDKLKRIVAWLLIALAQRADTYGTISELLNNHDIHVDEMLKEG